MSAIVRIFLMAAAGNWLAASCATDAVHRDLTNDHDPRLGRLCEVTIGTARNALPGGRVVFRYPEGMEEERLLIPICGGRAEAELAFDDSQRVDLIIVSGTRTCLYGLCIGDRHGKASANPLVQPFFTRAEGGMVSLLRLDTGVGYSFDLEDLPGECLDGRQPCTDINRLRLDAIIISRPAVDRSR